MHRQGEGNEITKCQDKGSWKGKGQVNGTMGCSSDCVTTAGGWDTRRIGAQRRTSMGSPHRTERIGETAPRDTRRAASKQDTQKVLKSVPRRPFGPLEASMTRQTRLLSPQIPDKAAEPHYVPEQAPRPCSSRRPSRHPPLRSASGSGDSFSCRTCLKGEPSAECWIGRYASAGI